MISSSRRLWARLPAAAALPRHASHRLALPSTARFSSACTNSGGKVSPESELLRTLDVPKRDAEFVGLTGAQIVHQMLRQHGVKHVFGYPGGAILPVYDAIYESPHFQFILSRHEQGAGHMAEGYARVSGKPGVCLVTSGPGATNLVTPLQDALMDGIPMVAFTGQVPTSAVGTDAFQEADVVGITRSCTKWNVLVNNIKELPRRINEAFYIANSGRPGPVLVDLPKDVTAATLRREVSSAPRLPAYQLARSHGAAEADVIAQAAALINIAKRPVIYCGAGVLTAEGTHELRRLAETANIPVTTTLQGLGAFDEEHPLSLKFLGMHGAAYANYAMQSADLIIAIGARFDDRVTGRLLDFAPAARKAELEGRGGIIHLDVAGKNIDKVVDTTIQVRGDCRLNMEALLPHVRSAPRAEWMEKLAAWKRDYPFFFLPHDPSDPSAKLKPQSVIEELYEQTKHLGDQLIITTGVGQHQMWAAQHMKWRYPRTWVTSGGLGTMGFGLPSAIGAQLAAPGKMVVDVDGDASYCMTGMELLTAAQYRVPVKILVLNNDFQGMVKQWQDLFYEERYSGTPMVNPNFAKLAEACNCTGLRCERPGDLAAKMREFLAAPGPVLLEVLVDKSEHVYPMVAAGKALHQMVFHPAMKIPAKPPIA